MRENGSGLKSNLNQVDKHKLDSSDYSDIPELPEEFFTRGQLYRNGASIERRTRGKQKRPTKRQLTIRLDSEIVDFFKNQGKGWQTKINEILHKYVDSQYHA